MRHRARSLPDVPIHHLLWTIPESFGGMTTVALRRASIFADTHKRRMDVLTLAPDFSPARRQRELHEDGIIYRRVRVRNLWSELRRAGDRTLARLGKNTPEVSHRDHERTPTRGSVDFELENDSGELIQIARFRANGSLLLTDRQDVKTPGKRGGRRLTVYARNGAPLGQWATATAFYQRWLKMVVGKKQSIILSDSAFVGGLMHSFSSPYVSMVQALHSHHRNDARRTLGKLVDRNFVVLSNADRFDRLAVLTERQRDDLLRENVGSDNLVAVPNPFHGEAIRTIEPRTRERGIVLARLSKIKRLDHAVRAIAASTHSAQPTLDVYGDGEDRSRIAEQIAALGLDGSVRLHGHDAKARDQFAHSSFSLLTSRAEGQSLMLVESMASGCIPIAYDIDYGPSDIITDGVDGFLVDAQDPEALGGTLDRFLSMDEADVAEMRKAAVATSTRFSAEAITARWGSVLRDVVNAAPPSKSRGLNANVSAQLVGTSVTGGQLHVSLRLDGVSPPTAEWAKITWVGRGKDGYMRRPLRLSESEQGLLLTGEVPVDQLVVGPSGLLDMFVDVRVSGARVRRRVGIGVASVPSPVGDLELYATAHENASLRRPKSIADASPAA